MKHHSTPISTLGIVFWALDVASHSCFLIIQTYIFIHSLRIKEMSQNLYRQQWTEVGYRQEYHKAQLWLGTSWK